jgi:hypothetical protein
MIEAGLAGWRLAHMLVHEEGPGAIFARLRLWAGIGIVPVQRPDGTMVEATLARTWVAQGLTCVWCVSVWTAALFVLAATADGRLAAQTGGRRRSLGWPLALIRQILAVSALAIAFHEGVAWLRSRP